MAYLEQRSFYIDLCCDNEDLSREMGFFEKNMI